MVGQTFRRSGTRARYLSWRLSTRQTRRCRRFNTCSRTPEHAIQDAGGEIVVLSYNNTARSACVLPSLGDLSITALTPRRAAIPKRGRSRMPIRRLNRRDGSVTLRVGYHVLDVPSHSATPCGREQELGANTSAACLVQKPRYIASCRFEADCNQEILQK